MAKDYYAILGVSKHADAAQIKKAYRKLAKKYHPDVSKEAGAEEKFKEVQAAYAVLSEEENRKLYDQFGEHWQQAKLAKEKGFDPGMGGSGGFGGGGSRSRPFGFEGFEGFHSYAQGNPEDIFSELFGGKSRQSRQAPPVQGEDRHFSLSLDLLEAYQGTSQTLTLGANRSAIKVKIPAGVIEGQKIRLAGQGEASPHPQGKPGDLYLEIHLKPHPYFKTDKADLYLDLPIAPWEAALGAKVTVPTLQGAVELTLPPGTHSGQKFRLKEKGLPANPKGHQYCMIQIVTPEPTTPEEKAFYQSFAQQFPQFNPRSHFNHEKTA